MRHQHLLIRRLATLIRSRMTRLGHLAQTVQQEGRGNCLPPSRGCSPACIESQELVALAEPYLRPATVKPPRKQPMVVLKPPARRVKTRSVQPDLFGEAM